MKRIVFGIAAALVASAGLLPAGLPTAQAGETLGGLAAAQRTQHLVDTASRAWFDSEWHAYAARFVSPDGRVRDNGNGDISHSEGQGYGLLLAAKAGDAKSFDTIWRWTAVNLMVRPDGLAAWKWNPITKTVADTNNATDGDILIAWGLAEGSKRFGKPEYRQAAEAVARAIGAASIKTNKRGPVLLPGAKGFDAGEQPDGPVINLSYWVYPAFAVLKELAPDVDWAGVRHAGLAILEDSRFGAFRLPTDWESLSGPKPQPAAGFPAAFGYNAIRIPLYLAMDGGDDARRVLRRFGAAWTQGASAAQLLDSKVAAVTLPIGEPGYATVLAVARCATARSKIPPEMIATRSDLYYPETLRLLSTLAIQERFPACL